MNTEQNTQKEARDEDRLRGVLLAERNLSLWQRLLITFALMLVLILLVYHFNIPNPNMILIAGLVVCSSMFGYSGGLPAGIIMLGYTLFFFSTDNDFVTFTDQNTRKVVVSLVGIVVDMLFICELKRAQRSAYRKIAGLTEELREDNRLLQELSLIDGLTGVKNRVSLRRDYDDYRYRALFVAMMDLDDFKSINDLHGHEAGDRVLTATGRNLNEIFGHDHCYRFGGDEFLILWPAGTEEAFRAKLDELIARAPLIGVGEKAACCIGFTHGTVSDEQELRSMFAQADRKMYEAKQRGPNTVVGD